MKKVKIISKLERTGPFLLDKRKWNQLMKLDNGTLTETIQSFIFETTDNLKITIQKETVLIESDFIITYLGTLEGLSKTPILLQRQKLIPRYFLLYSFLSSDFFVEFETYN